MKKLFLSLIIICLLQTINAQFTKIGGGLTTGSGIAWNNEMDIVSHRTQILAVTFKGIYELNLPFHIEPSFTWYMPRVTKEDLGPSTYKQIMSSIMFDVNGHYVFNSLDKFEFYGLAGLNITFMGMKYVTEVDGDKSKSKYTDNAFGLNVGAGAYMKLTDQFDLYGEAKYVISKYDQLMVNVGVLINIDWLIKHENTGM